MIAVLGPTVIAEMQLVRKVEGLWVKYTNVKLQKFCQKKTVIPHFPRRRERKSMNEAEAQRGVCADEEILGPPERRWKRHPLHYPSRN
jgi:hypothetical protein